MKPGPQKILVDTNVWIDYYLDRNRRAHDIAHDLIIESSRQGMALYTSAAALSDLFFILCQESKRLAREDGLTVTVGMTAAIREAAWATLRNIMELSIVVPIGKSEAYAALTYRPVHDDFEDDLILAAATRADVDYVVTSDASLAKHAPIACLSPADLLALLQSEGGSKKL